MRSSSGSTPPRSTEPTAEDLITPAGYSYVTTGSFFRAVRRPVLRILGTEMAGEVAAAVTTFAIGDAVFGVNAGRFGAHAEYMCMREHASLARKPGGMPYEEAAAICDGALVALGYLRRADLRPGRQILIYGASGAIGTAGVQLARSFNAHVTAVCGTRNVELARSLGSDAVIDYTRVDFARNGET